MELDAYKMRLIREILNVDSLDVLDSLACFFNKNEQRKILREYSEVEILAMVEKSEEEISAGRAIASDKVHSEMQQFIESL